MAEPEPPPAPAPEFAAAPEPTTLPVVAPSAVAGGTPLLTINMPTPEPSPPPPLARPPAMVKLPDLPHPSHYPPPAPIPSGPDTEECGVTWTGAEWVVNECFDPGAHTAQAKAAKVVIPYELMRQPKNALPVMVDHRAEGTEGPVRHQGGNQCTAFAFTSALDHAYARWTGRPGFFSVMQVYARYRGSSEHGAAEANIGDSLGNETDWPYEGHLASAWRRCSPDPTKIKPGTRCSEVPDAQKLASMDASGIAEVTQIEVIGMRQMDVLREKLAAGLDVTLGVKLKSFATAGEPGAKYVVGEADTKHRHLILLSGYAMTPNGNYYLVHNSWGTKWGDDGYAWIHEDILRAQTFDKFMYVPDLQPKQIASLRVHEGTGLASKCQDGMLPDSISGACAGRCPDGSPRHNNVCAVAPNPCGTGTVNLTGACLPSAPKSTGKDPRSLVRWECGPGGCAYVIPNGQLGCGAQECAVSCPAPMFRLATTQTAGLACVE